MNLLRRMICLLFDHDCERFIVPGAHRPLEGKTMHFWVLSRHGKCRRCQQWNHQMAS